MKKSNLMVTTFLTILFLMLAPLSAFADTLLTQMGGNPVVVSEGQIIENVLAVDSDARVSGTVNDLVLVINGDVYLEPTSHVNLVIDLGGNVHNHSLVPAKNGIFEIYLYFATDQSLFDCRRYACWVLVYKANRESVRNYSLDVFRLSREKLPKSIFETIRRRY